jgi:hypothetical protein
MRKLRLLSTLLFALSFVLVNCTKEGPEGPVGAIGPQGPSGNTGTANVIYSSWTNEPANWGADTNMTSIAIPVGNAKRFNVAAPSLSQSVLDQGTILAYYRNVPTGNNPVSLAANFNAGGTLFEINFRAALNRIVYFYWVPANPGVAVGPTSITGGATQFRYIIIPGSIAGGRGVNPGIGGTGYTEAEIKAMPYEKVCELLQIPK